MFYFSHIVHKNLAINFLNEIQLAAKASLIEIRERKKYCENHSMKCSRLT